MNVQAIRESLTMAQSLLSTINDLQNYDATLKDLESLEAQLITLLATAEDIKDKMSAATLVINDSEMEEEEEIDESLLAGLDAHIIGRQ